MTTLNLNLKATKSATRQIDAMLALPLAHFRRALTHLTEDQLAAVESRIAVLMIRGRWARGSHGVARHRAAKDLALLTRRQAEMRRESAARQTPAPAPISLIDAVRAREVAPSGWEDRAA